MAGLTAVALGGAASGSCGGGGDSVSSEDAGTVDAGFVLTCQDDPRVTAYAPGITATSIDGQMKVVFMSADPAPPADGLDSWSVKITDGSGNPLPNLPLIGSPTTLFMPDMGHGANAPYIDGGAGGIYNYTEANLFMPGIWRVTFAVDGGESAQIFFCITG